MSRRFTLEEAESLLPDIEKGVREAVSVKSEFEQAQNELQAITQRVPLGNPSVRGDLLAKLGRLDEAREELERAASLTRNTRERKLLLERAAACARETA